MPRRLHRRAPRQHDLRADQIGRAAGAAVVPPGARGATRPSRWPSVTGSAGCWSSSASSSPSDQALHRLLGDLAARWASLRTAPRRLRRPHRGPRARGRAMCAAARNHRHRPDHRRFGGGHGCNARVFKQVQLPCTPPPTNIHLSFDLL